MENYILLITGALLLLGGLMVYFSINLDEGNSYFMSMLVALMATMSFFGGYMLSQKETAIKCLNDKNPYKEQIVYEWQDSIQVPVYTIYSLKK